jgi:hypothetical protein
MRMIGLPCLIHLNVGRADGDALGSAAPATT